MRFLYDLGVFAYSLLLRIISPFHPKAKQWIEGRKGLMDRIAQSIDPGHQYVWFHFASLGEFEQGRSVMEAIRSRYPEEKIIVTFFSPSGFQIRKSSPLADHVFYLPVDTAKNARRFLDLVKPKLAIFTKYEYWYHYFNQLQRRDIPLLMISAIFRENQLFFKAYGGFYRSILRKVSFFFTQNKDSVHMLKWIGLTNAGLAGDTRFDRVVTLPKENIRVAEVEQFAVGMPLLVAGSTWSDDEKLLTQWAKNQPRWKMVIAPHEVDAAHLLELESRFPDAVLFSRFTSYPAQAIQQARVLIIDHVGLLSALYRYGKVAYVGGGFGAGIHNTLEAATYGIPVIFGPRYEKFQEAIDLIEEEAAFSIGNFEEFTAVFRALEQKDRWTTAGSAAWRYVQRNAGATQIIMKYLASKQLIGSVNPGGNQ
ncbi:MAG TPA: 3-deoxy-D-manno-octulosonic acid transferase [Candidatus Sphingobacterium stercorigallinarum]|nr:3-deoxy-D-manno-octulosonic acid transferase [Candidatus Sphingobacterium stercorigallinarum]